MHNFDDWFSLFKKGNRDILENIYVTEYAKFCNYANRFSESNKEIFFDIFQDSLMIMWEKCLLGKFLPNNKSEFEAYLFTISKNQYISFKRRDNKTSSLSFIDIAGEMEEEKDSTYEEAVMEALKLMGEKCKKIIQLYYVENLSLQQIAQQLEHSEDSIKTMKFRCISKLKELVKNKLS